MEFLNVQNRSLKPELMDQSNIDWNLHREALEGLERVNSFSLISGPIWEAITQVVDPKKKLKILDIATGAGDLPLMFAHKARQLDFNFEIHACDKSSQAIKEAGFQS